MREQAAQDSLQYYKYCVTRRRQPTSVTIGGPAETRAVFWESSTKCCEGLVNVTPTKTKVQLKAEIEQARRELWELHEESEPRIQALREAEEGLRADMEELRGVVQESNRQLEEKTVWQEEAEAQV